MTSVLIISIIHILALALWAADSRALEYIIKRFNYRRSMPQPQPDGGQPEKNEKSEAEDIDDKFKELIMSAYKNQAGRWDVWGPDVKQSGARTASEKMNNFYKTDRPLESLFDGLMEELEKTEPEIYKLVMRKHFFRHRRRREKDEDF